MCSINTLSANTGPGLKMDAKKKAAVIAAKNVEGKLCGLVSEVSACRVQGLKAWKLSERLCQKG